MGRELLVVFNQENHAPDLRVASWAGSNAQRPRWFEPSAPGGALSFKVCLGFRRCSQLYKF